MSSPVRPTRARDRWIFAVTLAEAVGYMIPASTGILLTKLGFPDAHVAFAVVAAGLGEGLCLGAGQAWAFPLPIRRVRYALLTSIGAGLVWAAVMMAMQLAKLDIPPGGTVATATIAALFGVVGIGGAQWLELRHHTDKAHRWVLWTALAWMLALPLSFLPGPLVDESTPLTVHLALWFCGGLLMAFVMSAITWQGVRRLPGPTGAPGAPVS